MAKPNKHFQSLNKTYLFQEIEKRVFLFKNKMPNTPIYNLGIGDISEPMSELVISTICNATRELQQENTFKGYGPAEGYDFLRKAIATNDYHSLNIDENDIFIVNGSKDAISNFQELFSTSNTIAIMDPTYPVYLDSNIIGGRIKKITLLPCLEENNFLPQIPKHHCDIIYLCSPNNPTGAALSKQDLEQWISFALEHNSIIFYDGAYFSFITDNNIPKSIYEIKNANKVCVEFRSFSKMAGFTNLRCSYVVIPKEINIDNVNLQALWKRRIGAKFGGVPYPIQKGATILYSPQGQQEIKIKMQDYHKRALFIANKLKEFNLITYGSTNSPYIWCKTPNNQPSFSFFDHLLETAQIVTIPGSGFGNCGEGFIRFSAFQKQSYIEQAFKNFQKGALPLSSPPKDKSLGILK
jgi:LL-diaminopimelate aminotransferase